MSSELCRRQIVRYPGRLWLRAKLHEYGVVQASSCDAIIPSGTRWFGVRICSVRQGPVCSSCFIKANEKWDRVHKRREATVDLDLSGSSFHFLRDNMHVHGRGITQELMYCGKIQIPSPALLRRPSENYLGDMFFRTILATSSATLFPSARTT